MKFRFVCATLLVEKSPQALPLGVACIASALKHEPQLSQSAVELRSFSLEDGFLKSCHDDKERADALFARLSEKKSRDERTVVFLAVYVWNRMVLCRTARLLSDAGILTVAGGPEVTAHPSSFSEFDFLVCGEGERPCVGLAVSLVQEKPLPGRILERGTSVALETLPSPYLDGTINPVEFGGALWELARGCPFKCSYCYESRGEKSVRFFSKERLEQELKLFGTLGVPQVFVLDPTYNADRTRALEMLSLIQKHAPGTFFYFEARAEFITAELAKAFTKIPCAVQIGLQSTDETVLAKVHRPFNKKQFSRGIGFLNAAGVTFGLDMIYGLPGDTLSGFKKSVDFALSLYPNNLELFCLSVLPGTDLSDRATELHLTFMPQPPYHVLHTDLFPESDICAAQRLSAATDFFYNQGRAVPWFNAVCKSLRLRPSVFLERFSESQEFSGEVCCGHQKIEQKQLSFVSRLFRNQHQEKYLKAVSDLIRLHGALSRTQDTGRPETVLLHYNAEYLFSQYASDLAFFVANVKPSACKIRTYKTAHLADFSIIQ